MNKVTKAEGIQGLPELALLGNNVRGQIARLRPGEIGVVTHLHGNAVCTISAWNLNHRILAKQIPDGVLRVIEHLAPDVIVLTEYVDGDGRPDFKRALRDLGYGSISVSSQVAGHNQVLIASKAPHEKCGLDLPTEESHSQSNFLAVAIPEAGLRVVGLRAPAFKRTVETTKYWEALSSLILSEAFAPTVFIGDLNADPRNSDSPGGGFLRVLEKQGLQVPDPEGAWSYSAPKAKFTSRIDHIIAGNAIEIRSSRYLTDVAGHRLAGEGLEKALSDHAILLAEVVALPPFELVLEVLAELGSIRLLGRKVGDRWHFFASSEDQTPELLNEPWIQTGSKPVDSWEAALALLDEYPWVRFSPRRIHPMFHESIMQAVEVRGKELPSRYLDRWRSFVQRARS